MFLAGAIGAEVAGTLALRSLAAEFRWGPAAVVTIGYLVSFVLLALALALALHSVHVGIAYAVCSGVGTAGVAVLARVLYGERISAAGVLGLALIVAGVGLLSLSGAG